MLAAGFGVGQRLLQLRRVPRLVSGLQFRNGKEISLNSDEFTKKRKELTR